VDEDEEVEVVRAVAGEVGCVGDVLPGADPDDGSVCVVVVSNFKDSSAV